MKATTGFFMEARMNSAAFSSSSPPISPISTTPAVPGSASNSSSSSTKPVPMTGSPPTPTQVDCPMPARVSAQTTS